MISLGCPNCGAALQISDSLENFACGYCGSVQVVERWGGTVSLKLVQAAVDGLRIGIDRTAAELALVRLKDDLAKIDQRIETLKGSRAAKEMELSPLAQLALVVFILSTCVLYRDYEFETASLALVALAIAGIAFAAIREEALRLAKSRADLEFKAALADLGEKRGKLSAEIEENLDLLNRK